MRERDIVYMRGGHYVVREPKYGSYTVMKHVGTHATTDSAYPATPDGLSLAQARVDYLARKKVPGGSLHQRIATALGWTIGQVQSTAPGFLVELLKPVDSGLAEELREYTVSGQAIIGPRRPKRNPMSRKSGLTRAKAREMLDEHDYTSEQQRRFLGARASGEPRRNPRSTAPGWHVMTFPFRPLNAQGVERARANRDKWITAHEATNEIREIVVDNAYGVEYRPLHGIGSLRNPRSAGTWGVWAVDDQYGIIAVAVAHSREEAAQEAAQIAPRLKLIEIVLGLPEKKALEAGQRVAQRFGLDTVKGLVIPPRRRS